jgi:hypothetical protein
MQQHPSISGDQELVDNTGCSDRWRDAGVIHVMEFSSGREYRSASQLGTDASGVVKSEGRGQRLQRMTGYQCPPHTVNESDAFGPHALTWRVPHKHSPPDH